MASSSSVPPFPPPPPPAGQQHEQVDEPLEQLWSSNRSTIQNIVPSNENWKIQTLPLARVKKIMKSEEFVLHEIEKERRSSAVKTAIEAGQEPSPEDSKPPSKFMISAEAPILMSKACELLVKELTFRSWRHTERNRRRTLQKQDVHAAVGESEVYDFLIDIVPRVAPTTKSSGQQKSKRQQKQQQQQQQQLQHHFPQHPSPTPHQVFHHQHPAYAHAHAPSADATAAAAAVAAAGLPNEYVIQQMQQQFQLQQHQQNFLQQDQQRLQMDHVPVPVPAPPAAMAATMLPSSQHQHHLHQPAVSSQGVVTSYHSNSAAHQQPHASAVPGYPQPGIDQSQQQQPQSHTQSFHQYNATSHSTATPADANATGALLSHSLPPQSHSQPRPHVYQDTTAPSMMMQPGSTTTTTPSSEPHESQQQWSTPASHHQNHHHHFFPAGSGDFDNQGGHHHQEGLSHHTHHHLAGSGANSTNGHQISPPK
eukprot:CAMPEP_0113483960 /NCGR_PEP_ID=MMETSP0014_2-20120614/23707_1 /TAXON_ID=2857 /ORGANISM="Nitzschia sp." /LENGTH=478 /DNA_ID=CAMNT_0000377531 /DNA_START=532 /DNA_END=1968 /DNA_ORIENTATION=+ /assembly_acc=CAM_ASM_000159